MADLVAFLLDLNVKNDTLVTWALVLGVIALALLIIFMVVGHWPWHRGG